MLFDANSAIFQLYHGENKLIFNEMMMRISGGKQRQMNKKNDFEFQMC
jgi:hypothetical protein